MVTMKDNENIYTTQYQNVTNFNDGFIQATVARTLQHNNKVEEQWQLFYQSFYTNSNRIQFHQSQELI